MVRQPEGTVTFLFSDIEGSTRLLDRLGAERYAEALDLHRRLVREAFERHDGYEVDSEGDAFFVAFASASEAVAAAVEAQQALAAASWPEDGAPRVRMGLHTGEPLAAPPKYVGLDVHKAARIMAAGHGGQVLVSAATERLLDRTSSVTGLGEHRLKDLSQPEPLYQLHVPGLPSEFPSLKTLGNRPTNLPVQPTPLVGRDDEVRRVSEVLTDVEVRLLTLTGPGGIGKTRLALQAAAELLEQFTSGVFFVSLAPVEDPALVIAEVARTLAVREQPAEEIARTLADYLERKQMLLVLDNFEQVVEAAPQVAALVEDCPELKLLVTSRERLGVRAEIEHEVPPLATTDAADLLVTLARRFDHRFEPDEHVAEIARRLDGLPLALELAAARVKVLTTAQISERLGESLDLLTGGARDAPERQRTLRTTVRWSYELLSEPERAAFLRLSSFTGSFELDAAEAVAGANVDDMSSLVDKSLVRRTQEGRFFLLETIRQFAVEELEQRGLIEEAREAHAQYYLQLARECAPAPYAPIEEAWAQTFLLEEPQLRTALATFHSHGRLRQRRELCLALWYSWSHFGRLAEGRAQLEGALEGPADDRLQHAMLEEGLSCIVLWQGDGPTAVAAAERAVSTLRELGERWQLAHALRALANAYRVVGDSISDDRALAESAEVARATGNVFAECAALVVRGSFAFQRGDDEAALEFSTAAVELGAAHSFPEVAAAAHHTCGLAQFRMGRLDAAEASLKASIVAYTSTVGTLHCVSGLAAVAARRSDFLRAARLVGAADRLRDETGIEFQDVDGGEIYREADAATLAALGPTRYAEASAEGAELSLDDLVEEALSGSPVAPTPQTSR